VPGWSVFLTFVLFPFRVRCSSLLKPIYEGLLQKKSPKSILGRHLWQERYFALYPHQLCYYKKKEDMSDESKALGFLLVEHMVSRV
jgi:hypothetical protein